MKKFLGTSKAIRTANKINKILNNSKTKSSLEIVEIKATKNNLLGTLRPKRWYCYVFINRRTTKKYEFWFHRSELLLNNIAFISKLYSVLVDIDVGLGK